MRSLIFIVLVAFCWAEEDASTEPVVCPDVIYYNTTFWKEHFDMDWCAPTGIYFKLEYMSAENTTDLPPTFPAGAERPFAMHAYLLMGEEHRMYWVKYPSDQIMHWYQGATAKIFVINPATGKMERRTLNARNVVTVIEADWWTAIEVRSAGKDRYVLMGCTLAPAVYDSIDMKVARPGDIQTDDKATRRRIRMFLNPNLDMAMDMGMMKK